MINKIVYFRYLPLTEKVYRDFYMQEIVDAGFDVEYWYLPFVISVPSGIEYYNNGCVKIVSSYKELNKRLKHEDKEHTLFISIQTYTWSVLRLFWVMSRNKCKLSVFGKNMIPTPFKAKASSILQCSPSLIVKRILNRLALFLKKCGVVKSYEVLFISGQMGVNAYGYRTSREMHISKHILINGDDYDRAMSLKSGMRILEDNYIVFIDTCLPLHPDLKICNMDAMNPDVYYKELNLFFDKIEKETGLKVVIAAHPKALIYKEKDFFEGRNVIYGKTAELIRDSELVLFHNSTSIGYAVCFDKPIISMVSTSLREGQRDTFESSLCFSEELDTRLVFIDDYCNNNHSGICNELSINREAYDRYKYRYLTNPNTENINSSYLVIQGLKSL